MRSATSDLRFPFPERCAQFSVLPFVAGGLKDGMNPLAWVTVLYLAWALVALRRNRKEIFVSGFFFIMSLAVTLFIVLSGKLDSFCETLMFSWISTLVYSGLMISALLIGFLSFRDWLIFKKTGERDRLNLKWAWGNGPAKAGGKSANEKHFWILLLSASVLNGFLLGLLQTQFPPSVSMVANMYMLLVQDLRQQVVKDLSLYCVCYVVPLLFIWLVLLWASGEKRFSSLLDKNLETVKMMTSALFLSAGLGLGFMLFQPYMGIVR